MEKFIALCLCLPLLIVFIPQNGLNTVNNAKISQVKVAVEMAKEQAKQEGYFSSEIVDELQDNLEDLGFASSEIVINVTDTPKYRVNTYDEREMIHYEIGVPIKKLIFANKMFGIADSDNESMYYLRGKIGSERID